MNPRCCFSVYLHPYIYIVVSGKWNPCSLNACCGVFIFCYYIVYTYLQMILITDLRAVYSMYLYNWVFLLFLQLLASQILFSWWLILNNTASRDQRVHYVKQQSICHELAVSPKCCSNHTSVELVWVLSHCWEATEKTNPAFHTHAGQVWNGYFPLVR